MCTVQVKIISAFPFPGVREIFSLRREYHELQFEFAIVTGLERGYTAGFGICLQKNIFFQTTIDR